LISVGHFSGELSRLESSPFLVSKAKLKFPQDLQGFEFFVERIAVEPPGVEYKALKISKMGIID